MSEIYFVCREDRQMLDKLLGEIPGLIDDLAITICRQDRTGKGGMKISSGSDEQPMPFNVGASDAGDYLRNELNTWARLVCEERYISYDGSDSVVGVSVWLRKNLASLAMTQGAEDALPGIESAMKRCRRAMDLPAEDPPSWDEEMVERAMNQAVTATQAQLLMGRLGHPPLKAATISKWFERGHLEVDDRGFFRLGDILARNPRKVVDEDGCRSDAVSRLAC